MGNKDYIDTVVLTDESRAIKAATKHPFGTNLYMPNISGVRMTRVGGVDVNKLTIDESSDGGDPYNSTGKHCVLKRPKD